MNRVMHVLAVVAAGLFVGLSLNYVLDFRYQSKRIKVEAPPPLSVHPVSSEFSTGYILVEVWTQNGESMYPHIVRMRRSEYLEWVNPKVER